MGINSTIKIYFENIVTLAYLFKIINIKYIMTKKVNGSIYYIIY